MSNAWLLFLHLAGAFLFVSGAVAAAVLRVAAMRAQRPSEVAVLLRTARSAVPVIAVGLLLVLVFGFWLVDRLDVGFGSSWLVATLVLLGWTLVVGVVAGRQDRRTRELAEQFAAHGDHAGQELGRRLRDPLNLTLNLSLLAATIAIVALMVWKPG